MNSLIINKFLIVSLIAGVIQLLFSCNTLREFEIDPEPDQIVIGGAFPVDSIMEVGISRSRFILNNDDLFDAALKGAIVNVFEGDQLIDQLMYFQGEYEKEYLPALYRSTLGFKPEIGRTYNIEVHHEGFTSARSSTTILPRVMINTMEIENRKVKISEDYSGLPVTITFNDPKGEENYYRVQASYTYSFESFESDHVINNQPPSSLWLAPKINQGQDLSTEGYPFLSGLYFADKSFNGEKYSFDFFVNALQLLESIVREFDNGEIEKPSVNVTISFQHITKEHYDFGITGQLQLELSDDPFAEPVPVKSNVDDGLGIFAGYSHDTASQEINQN